MAGKTPTFTAFYVAFGAEPFYLDRYIEQARRTRRRVILLDGDGLKDADLVELLESTSDDPRTFVLDNAQDLKGEAELLRYCEAKNPADQSVVLVAIVRAERLPELWASVADRGKSQEWKRIKPWEQDQYLDFVSKEATRNRVTIRKEASELLFQCTGPDLYRLANELKKLAVYVGEGEITKNHVAQVATRTLYAEPPMVADAVMAKNPERALHLFAEITIRSGESQYVAVAYQLMKQVETTVVVRSMLDKGMPSAEVAALLGHNPWRFNEAIAPVARKHELPQLIRYMGQLSKLDVDLKSSLPFKRTMVEMVMLSMAH
jgi:DNA polymerase III subunit delta